MTEQTAGAAASAAPPAGGALSGAGRDVVVLRLPAAGAYLSVLRTATASLASRLDFTIDDIEDLFVRPSARRLGLGRMLLRTLAAVCVERGYPRFEWWVLDWNEPAHAFYRSLGAQPQDDWTTWRVDGAALSALAAG